MEHVVIFCGDYGNGDGSGSYSEYRFHRCCEEIELIPFGQIIRYSVPAKHWNKLQICPFVKCDDHKVLVSVIYSLLKVKLLD